MSWTMATDLLQEAIVTIQSGDRAAGQRLLIAVLKVDPFNESALLWLATTSNDSAWRRECFERVLAINPNNTAAQQALATQETPPPPSSVEPSAEPVIAPPLPQTEISPSPSDKLQALSKRKYTKKCPYCTKTNQMKAQVCRFCGRDLITGKGSR